MFAVFTIPEHALEQYRQNLSQAIDRNKVAFTPCIPDIQDELNALILSWGFVTVPSEYGITVMR